MCTGTRSFSIRATHTARRKLKPRRNRSMKEAFVEHFRSPSHICSGGGYAA